MPWFRRKKQSQHQQQDDAAQAAAPPQAVAEAEPAAAQQADDTAPADGSDAQKKKRRRGSRGGRGRKKPGAQTGAEAVASEDGDQPAAAKSSSGRTPRAEGSQRSQRSERRANRSTSTQQRRRQQQRRAPLPAAKRELLISVDVGEQRVAILEDERVAEVYLERPERRSIAGNVYLGVVDNVLPGMEAAFVEIGLEKNGFLYVDEIVVPELEGRRHGRKIQDLISRGEKILVQAVKDPMKTKGARVTTEISLPGRFLVYVPNGEGLGVSRRLDDDERTRLKDIIKALDVSEGGVIVRTAADGASADDIERDFVFLQRLWKTIQARTKAATAPELVYQEAELPLRIVRDLFTGDFEAAHVDHDRAYKRIVGYLKKTSPHMIERVHRYKDAEPLLAKYGVDKEIESTLDRRVDLPSGGYLIFDYAEAFTVVDVNTGRFVGSRSKSSSQRLEDTITKNNLEAVKEVVRQLRLRDIGGIIVIDFIDMANPKNRAAVEDALRTELERDRTKTYVVEISPLGLVEMTRQNVTDGPREILTRKCPTCAGDGIVVSDSTVALEIERKLRALVTPGNRVQAYRIALHPQIVALLAGPGGERLAAIEDAARRRFFLVAAEGHVHTDHFEVLAEGKLVDLKPEAPFEDGAELSVKLAEVARYDGGAAVGKVDGVDVVVAGAAKLVGKKAGVVVGRVLDGQAFAALADGVTVESPITFESEAEKPTRAPAKRKGKVAPARDEEAVPEAVEEEEDATADTGDGEAAAAADTGDDAEDAPKPKKKTRRGSRGGRRKKPASATAAADGAEAASEGRAQDAPDAPPDEADGNAAPAGKPRRQPRIHVPDGEGAPRSRAKGGGAAKTAAIADADSDVAVADADGADGDATADGDGEPPKPKRKTRRGTRGGRSRRKKPTTAAAGTDGSSDGTDGSSDGTDGSSEETATEVPEAAEAPAEAVAEPAPEPEEEPEPDELAPVAVAAAADDEEYVPMSEWLDDFNR